MSAGPVSRKVLVFIGMPPAKFIPGLAGEYDLALAALQRANLTVYTFDPRGLLTRAGLASAHGTHVGNGFAPPPMSAYFPSFSELTGGVETTDDNTPWDVVTEMMRDTGRYYLIAYQSSNGVVDGRYRRIEVKVGRPGLEVRTRNGYFAGKPSKSPKIEAEASPIDIALARALPVSGVPLRLNTASFASGGAKQVTLALVTGVGAAGNADVDGQIAANAPITLITTVLDKEWKSVAMFRQTLDVTLQTPGVGTWFEVLSKFAVPPGRYEVRVAAERGDQFGSVFMDVEVPDFAKLPLSMSGLTLSREPARMTVGRDALADLLPRVPTSAREFLSSDHVVAFVHVYQGGNNPTLPVSMKTRVVSDTDEKVLDTTAMLGTAVFAPGRGADCALDLPLSGLTPGDYLLTVEATLGKRQAQQQTMFRILAPR